MKKEKVIYIVTSNAYETYPLLLGIFEKHEDATKYLNDNAWNWKDLALIPWWPGSLTKIQIPAQIKFKGFELSVRSGHGKLLYTENNEIRINYASGEVVYLKTKDDHLFFSEEFYSKLHKVQHLIGILYDLMAAKPERLEILDMLDDLVKTAYEDGKQHAQKSFLTAKAITLKT